MMMMMDGTFRLTILETASSCDLIVPVDIFATILAIIQWTIGTVGFVH
jgi:hypothetical protein